jgi:hypothetical protein
MSPKRAEIIRRSSRWATTFVVLALAPKCVWCVAAYLGVATTFGFGMSEICGAAPGSLGDWSTLLAVPTIALGVIGWLAHVRRAASAGPNR